MSEKTAPTPDIRVLIPTPEGCIDDTQPFDPKHNTWETQAQRMAAVLACRTLGVDHRLVIDGRSEITYLMKAHGQVGVCPVEDTTRYQHDPDLLAAVEAIRKSRSTQTSMSS